ncbi:chromosomal replication initiator protein DnaA [Brucella intermedia]|uniref:chromosomal replication initiator protein DnaA n=1 Tax=Brucella intermedia TaxID=94625 RepID=UPI000DFBF947|nr:chromosomal replication initiator protein DnaA [Brucella intermedia]WLF97839.1 chromosomal replication initiator protein DnaA [Brucella intermedia]SUB11590.1 Chromosomal replication initiator protein DnaA [Brucella intermedia]
MSGNAGDEVFERLTAKLKARVGTEIYSSWFGRLKLDDISKSIVRLSVPTAFLRSWINNHYSELLTELWQEENPQILKVEVVVRGVSRVVRSAAPVEACEASENKPVVAPREKMVFPLGQSFGGQPVGDKRGSAVVAESAAASGAVLGSPLDPRYTFDSFVDGASNRVALAAARTIAEAGSSAVRFNPLFIHASVGLGKTHLLQAIAAAALQRQEKARVVYLTAEYFMWRFATAIRDNNALSFKEQLRDIDLLVIDDMQFLQGKSIQHEFCHLLNTLLDSAKQVVVAADRAPSELESLDVRVRSRLQGGVALEVAAPDYEMRVEMLRRRLAAAQAEDPSLTIGEEILSHVARTVTGSGRELEGAFNQLLFRQSFEPNISIDRVDELLGHLTRVGEPKRIRIEEIQRIVARHYNVSKQDLLSNRRTRTIVKPRQVAMYLAKMMTPRSLPEIGRRFGGRDHTTVLHAVRKIEDLVGADTKLAQELELLKRLINDQAA